MARLDYDPSQVEDEPRGEFELLPDGIYAAQIIESDLVATKLGGGQMLNLTAEILEGPRAGRRVWDRINVVNKSPQAQEIGQRQLKRICTAVGHEGRLLDSEQLHFKPMRIRVGREADEGFRPKNVIKAYMPYNSRAGAYAPKTYAEATGHEESSREPAQASQPAQRAAANGARPWGAR